MNPKNNNAEMKMGNAITTLNIYLLYDKQNQKNSRPRSW